MDLLLLHILQICTFYQKGICAYGSRCRYDHVKDSHSPSTALSSSEIPLPVDPPFGAPVPAAADVATEHSASVRPFFSPSSEKFNDAGPSYLGICSFAAAGDCPRGESCPHIHGDLCPICERRCLHPSRPQERDEHMKICEKRRKHLEALRCSQEIECSVCLEAVLSKPTSAERKFGILSECDHSFCISCIRNWRSSSPASGINMNSAVRACPICRRLSYFVIPSVIWYSSREEKQDIVQSYKTKLRYNLGTHFFCISFSDETTCCKFATCSVSGLSIASTSTLGMEIVHSGRAASTGYVD